MISNASDKHQRVGNFILIVDILLCRRRRDFCPSFNYQRRRWVPQIYAPSTKPCCLVSTENQMGSSVFYFIPLLFSLKRQLMKWDSNSSLIIWRDFYNCFLFTSYRMMLFHLSSSCCISSYIVLDWRWTQNVNRLIISSRLKSELQHWYITLGFQFLVLSDREKITLIFTWSNYELEESHNFCSKLKSR